MPVVYIRHDELCSSPGALFPDDKKPNSRWCRPTVQSYLKSLTTRFAFACRQQLPYVLSRIGRFVWLGDWAQCVHGLFSGYFSSVVNLVQSIWKTLEESILWHNVFISSGVKGNSTLEVPLPDFCMTAQTSSGLKASSSNGILSCKITSLSNKMAVERFWAYLLKFWYRVSRLKEAVETLAVKKFS